MNFSVSSFLVIIIFSLVVVSSFAEEDIEHRSPTTRAPTTRAPTTRAATTHAPTTHEATTRAPTTHAPTTRSPPQGHGHGRPPFGGHRPPVSFPDEFYTEYELGNINVTKTLYDSLVFPTPALILAAEEYPAGIFTNVTSGRITPLGDFDDAVGSFEYFYGLAARGNVSSVKIIYIIAKANTVAVRVDLLFDAGPTGLLNNENLTQIGFLTFDENNFITSYDLAILRLGEAVGLVPPSEYLDYVEEICLVHQDNCTGANQQYANFEACVEQISSMNFGTWDNVSSNTTTCRILHSILVPLRPAFHCPHIGPTGGNACIDVPYSDFYDEYF